MNLDGIFSWYLTHSCLEIFETAVVILIYCTNENYFGIRQKEEKYFQKSCNTFPVIVYIINMTMAWPGSKRSFGWSFFFLLLTKIQHWLTVIYFATDFDENSMASRMNSGGSIDLNRIKIDPWTGEKFSFNLDIVAATAWYGQEASRELSHGRARNSVLTWIYM